MTTIDRNALSCDLFFLSHIQYMNETESIVFIANMVQKCDTLLCLKYVLKSRLVTSIYYRKMKKKIDVFKHQVKRKCCSLT